MAHVARKIFLFVLLLSVATSSSFIQQPSHLKARQYTSTVVAATITVYQPAPTTPPSPSYTDNTALIDGALKSTNFFRSQHNATSLTWNKTLADTAANWANQCQLAHSKGPDGENLAQGYPNITTAIDAWGKEREDYDFNEPTGFSEETGHFTQLVWKKTVGVGCAAVDCSGRNGTNGWLFVCEYYPRGNIIGDENAYFEQNIQSKIHDHGPPTTSSTAATAATTASSARGPPGLGAAPCGKEPQLFWTLAVSVAAVASAATMT